MKSMTFRTTYDADADAAYFYLSPDGLAGSVRSTLEIAADVIADLDAEGRLLGIEVLNARARLAPAFFQGAKAAAE